MSTSPTPSGDPDAAKRLVCGVCEELLPGTYATEDEAEAAADEHEQAEHGQMEDVVVVHVSSGLVDLEGEEGVVEIAKRAQKRLDEGDVGESLIG